MLKTDKVFGPVRSLQSLDLLCKAAWPESYLCQQLLVKPSCISFLVYTWHTCCFIYCNSLNKGLVIQHVSLSGLS